MEQCLTEEGRNSFPSICSINPGALILHPRGGWSILVYVRLLTKHLWEINRSDSNAEKSETVRSQVVAFSISPWKCKKPINRYRMTYWSAASSFSSGSPIVCSKLWEAFFPWRCLESFIQPRTVEQVKACCGCSGALGLTDGLVTGEQPFGPRRPCQRTT